jgi:hypothetical protein
MSVLLHFASLGSAYVVGGFIHLGDDMKAVKDVESVGASLANHAQAGLPPVGADELDFRGEFSPEHGEESLEGFYGSFFTVTGGLPVTARTDRWGTRSGADSDLQAATILSEADGLIDEARETVALVEKRDNLHGLMAKASTLQPAAATASQKRQDRNRDPQS